MAPVERGQGARAAFEELLKPGYAKEFLPATIMRKVQQFLGDLTDLLPGGGGAGGVLAAIGLALILLAVVGLVVWWLRRTSRRDAAAAARLFDTRELTAAEHRATAERLAAEEHWAEAVQERLRAIARDLEARALVDGMPGRTADELAAEAGAALPGFAAELVAAARDFDDIAYGGRPGTPEAYTRMRSLDERLQAARPILA
ncbi:DUF4129 domain-containing protein [Nonomuraea longicatena]|uniref:Protein-glutamine gamma-glutamyltransferase-like C-terminal domain-containing protein n=1 Tax=Nonomuraea longicatena TaxID=83682 RepID=A0ABN1PG61_9ACTN